MNLTFLGHWAFVIGILLAILAGFTAIEYLPTILFILGLIVGFLNVTEKESTPFLVAVIALLMVGMAGLQFGGEVLESILNNFIAFVAAAGLIVALKQVLAVAKPSSQ
jgi:hypothetical protein